MRIIDARDWAPEGTVTTWLPSDAMKETAQKAQDDPTPASFLQSDHVRGVLAARGQGRTHHAYTGSVATLPGVPDAARMTRAVNAFVAAHEGLRSGLSVAGDAPQEPIERRTLPAAAVDLVATGVPGVPGVPNVPGAITELLASTAVFDHVPALVVATVAREDAASFDLLFALDHASGDGLSQMTGLLELIARYNGATPDTTPSFLDYVRDEYARAASVHDDSPGVRAWRDMFAVTDGRVPGFPLPTGVVDGVPQPAVGWASDGALADRDTTARLRDLARAHQVSFSTVVYAALGVAHARLTGQEHYATVVVAATRGRIYALSQGWFCNFTPLFFPVSTDGVTAVLPDAAAAQARMKEALDEPVHASLGHLIGTGQVDASVMGSPQMVTYLDLGWFDEPANADVRLFTGVGRTANANLWISRNDAGLGLACQAPDNPTARESVRTYVATVREVLAEAAAVESAQ
ncbi:condensation domain-containing protein [Corynebacterium sp. AOP40-9SA-29]|uniref:condensation domain-containing protein n=1 Tax=Corynebacterium sp. AOP40-9SA-29 TaxID=3457677 RepID=UPI004034631F